MRADDVGDCADNHAREIAGNHVREIAGNHATTTRIIKKEDMMKQYEKPMMGIVLWAGADVVCGSNLTGGSDAGNGTDSGEFDFFGNDPASIGLSVN